MPVPPSKRTGRPRRSHAHNHRPVLCGLPRDGLPQPFARSGAHACTVALRSDLSQPEITHNALPCPVETSRAPAAGCVALGNHSGRTRSSIWRRSGPLISTALPELAPVGHSGPPRRPIGTAGIATGAPSAPPVPLPLTPSPQGEPSPHPRITAFAQVSTQMTPR